MARPNVTSAINHLTRRVHELEEKVDALLTQDHAGSRWGRSVEARLVSGEGDIGRLPDVSDEPAAMDSSRSRWTLRDARRALGRLLSDEDLTDEKLREAAGGILPRVHDAVARYVGRPAAARANDLAPYTAESLLEELVSRGRIHPSRLLEDHYVRMREDGFAMVHPLSCDLSECLYHEKAPRLQKHWEPGWYRWPRSAVASMVPVPEEELPFDPP